jgi:ribosomal protein L40E
MTTDYGLGAVTGIIPVALTAGVAMNLIDRVGLGAQQHQQMVKTDTCRKCGNSIPVDAKYCNVCGASTRTGRVLSPKYSKPAAGGKPIDVKQMVFGKPSFKMF